MNLVKEGSGGRKPSGLSDRGIQLTHSEIYRTDNKFSGAGWRTGFEGASRLSGLLS